MICELKNESKQTLKVVWDPLTHRSMLSRHCTVPATVIRFKDQGEATAKPEILPVNVMEFYPGIAGRLYCSEDPTYVNVQQYKSIPLFCCSGDMEKFLPLMQLAIAEVIDGAIGGHENILMDTKICQEKPAFRDMRLNNDTFKLGTLQISRKLAIQAFAQKDMKGIFKIQPVNQITLVHSLRYAIPNDTLDCIENSLRYICGVAWEVSSQSDPECHERYKNSSRFIPHHYRPSIMALRQIFN